mmetsp:Transcript_4409/g.13362  ORF Transcript_4409/g.13362 Transcript_4409/m.13362 type:complete len:279 (+) Transcript_4409:172-1008(+)
MRRLGVVAAGGNSPAFVRVCNIGLKVGPSRALRAERGRTIVRAARSPDNVFDEMKKELEKLQYKLEREKNKARALTDFFDETTFATKAGFAGAALGISSLIVSGIIGVIPLVLYAILVGGWLSVKEMRGGTGLWIFGTTLLLLSGNVQRLIEVGIISVVAYVYIKFFFKFDWLNEEPAVTEKVRDPLTVDFTNLRDFDAKLRSNSRSKNPERWSAKDVADELRAEGLESSAPLFLAEGIDGSTLLDLNETDLREEFPQLSLRTRKQIMKLIQRLRQSY